MRSGILLTSLLLLDGCAPTSETRRIAIVGAKLIDGKGGAPIEHSIVLIEGATFMKVGAQTSIPLPKDVEIVDGMGKTIEPVAGGTTIDAGHPASLKLDQRTMKDGQWLN